MEAKTNEALDTARETIDLFNSAKNQKVKDNLRDKHNTYINTKNKQKVIAGQAIASHSSFIFI